MSHEKTTLFERSERRNFGGSVVTRKHSATLTKTAFPLAELRLLNAGKWWFGPVDGFDVQMP